MTGDGGFRRADGGQTLDQPVTWARLLPAAEKLLKNYPPKA
jgi:hypothetical protein